MAESGPRYVVSVCKQGRLTMTAGKQTFFIVGNGSPHLQMIDFGHVKPPLTTNHNGLWFDNAFHILIVI